VVFGKNKKRSKEGDAPFHHLYPRGEREKKKHEGRAVPAFPVAGGKERKEGKLNHSGRREKRQKKRERGELRAHPECR